MNISALAKANGVLPVTAHQRIRRGWCWFKACTRKPQPYHYEWG